MVLDTQKELIKRMQETMTRILKPSERQVKLGLSSIVWEEGGEWYPFHSSYVQTSFGDSFRDLNSLPYARPANIAKIGPTIEKAFEEADEYAMSLPCGTGKSTSMIADIFALKLSKHAVVVLPSLVTARSIAEYCSSKGYHVDYSEIMVDPSDKRRCIYTSAACLLDGILRGVSICDTMVVLDESHSVTPVYRALRQALNRVQCKVLMLSASTTSSVVAIRGVRLTQIGANSPTLPTATLSSEIAKYGDSAITVGVLNGSYAVPANLLIGATCDIRVMFDTGLRPEPVVIDGALNVGERSATLSEIVQMVGRVGRTQNAGHAYYVSSARCLAATGLSLYDILYASYEVLIDGPKGSLTKEKAVNALRSNGLLPKPILKKLDEDVPVSKVTTSKVALDSSKRDSIGSSAVSVSRSSNDGRCVSASSVSTVESTGSVSADSECERLQDQSKVNFDDSSINTLSTLTPDKSQRTSYDCSLKRLKEISISGNSEGVGFVSDELRMQLRDIDKQVKVLTRPFSRGEVEFTYDKAEKHGITSLMYAMASVIDKGGSIHLDGPLCLVDKSQVESDDVDEARHVLAGDILPSYSEAEMMAVLVCWDNMAVASVKSYVRKNYASQFSRYFLGYAQYIKH